MTFDNGYTNAIFCTNCGARVHHGDSYWNSCCGKIINETILLIWRMREND